MKSIHAARRRIACICALFLCALVISGIPACEREDEPAGVGGLDPRGVLISHTGCKPFDSSSAIETPPNQDCVEWEYSAEGILSLKHVNAAFNCCPGEITADIVVSGDEITIVEHEETAACFCRCLYDIDYTIENLPPGVYTVQFVELYAFDDPRLVGSVELSPDATGSFCVDRTHYPWYEAGAPVEPSGRLVRTSGCGTEPVHFGSNDDYPTDLSCIDWLLYDGGMLRLRHINAVFNCCAVIGADISVEDGVITIAERESGPPCDCYCLYDLEFEITGITPGTYRVHVVEVYVHPGEEPLDFTADFATYPAGVYCAYRDYYPWGYSSSLPEDRAKLGAMAEVIHEYIGTPSCGSEGDCRYIGIGAKPCGGPWSYLIYSAATIDENELRYRVLRYNAWNHGMNCRHQLSSTCDVPPPPCPICLGGVCVDSSTLTRQ